MKKKRKSLNKVDIPGVLMICLLLVQSCYSVGQEKDHNYFGQKPPGNSPKVFAPGIISTKEGHEFCCSLSPDGKEFYFNRGMTILVSRFIEGKWSAPEPASFAKGYEAHEANITPDNKRVYFGMRKAHEKNLAAHMEYGIWTAKRESDGWGEPEYVGYAMYVTSTLAGQLYLTSIEELQ